MYFSSKFKLQRVKHQKGAHTLEYEIQEKYQLLDNNVFSELNCNNDSLEHSEQNVDNQLEHDGVVEPIPEVMFPSIENKDVTEESESLNNIPNQLSTEDVPTLEPEPPRKQLPECLARGIPKPTYEPQISSKAGYPIN